MKTTNHNFTNFVKYQCLTNLSSYEHTDRGKFYPSIGFIELNVDANEFINENDLNVYRPWRYSFIHESLHLYHLYSSSLGFLEVAVNDIQKIVLDIFLKEYIISSYHTFKDFIYSPDHNPFTILHNDNSLLNIVELRTLFGSGYDYLIKDEQPYIPKVMDYLQQIYIFYKIYWTIKDYDANKQKLEKCTTKLYNKLVPRLKLPSDYTLDATIFPEATKIMNYPLNYYLLNEEKIWLIPTRAIVEGYASFIETLIKREDRLILNSIDDYEYNSINKLESYGIYGATNSLLFSVLGSYLDIMTSKFAHTCFAIYELSLMSRVYPALLLGSDEISYEELFIPHRFIEVFFHLATQKKSIYDYCNSVNEIKKGMDEICDELNWMKYSDCLKILYKDADSYDEYSSSLMKRFLSDKIKGDFFPFTKTFSETIPSKSLIVACKDRINIIERYQGVYLFKAVHLLKDFYSRYVLYGYDLNKLSGFIDKYITKTIGKKDSVKLLTEEGLDELIDFV